MGIPKEENKKNPPEMDGTADMTSLLYLEEHNVLHNLMIRFKEKQVYTSVGSILISVNPYAWVAKYTKEEITRYNQSSFERLGPHCYQIAKRAKDFLKVNDVNQSILICGESGSGKTESSKVCMSFLTSTSNTDGKGNLENQIMAVNPILEAFGNAKTIRNNNSSRFGKYTKMIFTKFNKQNPKNSSKIIGSKLVSYLLEKSRIMYHEVGERNFHIFYQIFERNDSHLCLTNKSDFKYISLTKEHLKYHNIEGINDKKNYDRIIESLDILKVSKECQENLFELVAAILHLGNIEFEPASNDGSSISEKTKKYMDAAAKLLKIDIKALETRLTIKKIKVMREIISSPISVSEAYVNLNSISKSLYTIIFDWIFFICNKSFAEPQPKYPEENLRFIGILDVFGFECFLRNSLEQFCINFANEILQQLFSESLLINEQNEYISEGVYWVPLEIPNNDPMVDLISGKQNGIFDQLEAACNMPKGTADIFVSNVYSSNRKSKKLKRPKMTAELKKSLNKNERFNGFLIHHYAEDVIYNCNEFLIKNKDMISEETYEMFKTSKSVILSNFLSISKKSKNKKSGKKNIGKMFVDSLKILMNDLSLTSKHFIRCINPNTKKSSTIWDDTHVIEQLRCAGLIEALKVMKLGYPTRIKYTTLEENYKQLISHEMINDLPQQKFWQAVLIGFGYSVEKFEFGLTKIFFKPNVPFIQNMKEQNGPLTGKQLKRIKQFFISKRFTRLRGAALTYLRINYYIENRKLEEMIAIPITILLAFGSVTAKIRKKIAFEKAEAERKERERLEKERKIRLEKERIENERKERERIEKEKMERARKEKEERERIEREKLLAIENAKKEEERQAAIAKAKAEQEKLEKQRKIEEEKLRLENEERERKRLEEERIRLEQEKKEREEREKIELELKKQRELEEIENKKIAALVAVELIFGNLIYSEQNLDEFKEKLNNEISEFLEINQSRYDIVLINENCVVADIRFNDPNKEEQVIKDKQDFQEIKEKMRDSGISDLPPSLKKSTKDLLNSEKYTSLSKNESNSELLSTTVSEDSIDCENSKPKLRRISSSLKILSKEQLAMNLNDKDMSHLEKNSLLIQVTYKRGRNLKIKPVYISSKPVEKKSISRKILATTNKSVNLFIYSLSNNVDFFCRKYATGNLKDQHYFIKVLKKDIFEIIIHEDENCLIIKTPEKNTDIKYYVLPKQTIVKNRGEFVNEDYRDIFKKLCIRCIEVLDNKNDYYLDKYAIIVNHDKPTWSIIRFMNFNGVIAGRTLVYELKKWGNWKIELFNETILCYSKINISKIKLVRDGIYRESNKGRLFLNIFGNDSEDLGKKYMTIRLLWLMNDFEYYITLLKKNLFTLILKMLDVKNISNIRSKDGSRKVFKKTKDGDVDLDYPNTKAFFARCILRVLAYCSFYAKQVQWKSVLDQDLIFKITVIIKSQIKIGELKSDVTVNCVLIILAAFTNLKVELKKDVYIKLIENEFDKLITNLLLPTTHQMFSKAFSSRIASVIRWIIKYGDESKATKLINSISSVLYDYEKNIPRNEVSKEGNENLGIFASEMLDIICDKNKTPNKKKDKKKKFLKSFFQRK